MKKNLILISLIFITIPLFSEETKKAIVEVNGYPITESEINYELGQLEQQAMIAGEQQKIPLTYANIEELRDTVISALINKHLLLQECDNRKISITPEMITQNMNLLKNQFPGKQQFYDYLSESKISEEKLLYEIEVALRLDQLAEKIVNEQKLEIRNEEQKQNALAGLLTNLYKDAEISWIE